jgi:hypothetical protein
VPAAAGDDEERHGDGWREEARRHPDILTGIR